jgi:hypothetical protein
MKLAIDVEKELENYREQQLFKELRDKWGESYTTKAQGLKEDPIRLVDLQPHDTLKGLLERTHSQTVSCKSLNDMAKLKDRELTSSKLMSRKSRASYIRRSSDSSLANSKLHTGHLESPKNSKWMAQLIKIPSHCLPTRPLRLKRRTGKHSSTRGVDGAQLRTSTKRPLPTKVKGGTRKQRTTNWAESCMKIKQCKSPKEHDPYKQEIEAFTEFSQRGRSSAFIHSTLDSPLGPHSELHFFTKTRKSSFYSVEDSLLDSKDFMQPRHL